MMCCRFEVMKSRIVGLQGLYVIYCVFVLGDALQSLDLTPISSEMWGLPPPQEYNRIFTITPDNFKSKVLESDDVWIVLLYRRKISKIWKDMIASVGGAVWFGGVNVTRHPELLSKLNMVMPKGDEEKTLAVIFPMKNGKKYVAMEDGTLKTASHPTKALELASIYIPDKTVDFTFSDDQKQKFNDWVVKGYYYEQPPKFPVLCIMDDKETSVYLKVAAYYLATHFNIGVVRKTNVAAMRMVLKQVPEPKTYPTYLVLLGIEPTPEEMNAGSFQMSFNIMPYIEQKYGNPGQFSSLINFLFVANSDYRKNIPGRAPSEPDQVSKMEGIRNSLTRRLPKASAVQPSTTQFKSEL